MYTQQDLDELRAIQDRWTAYERAKERQKQVARRQALTTELAALEEDLAAKKQQHAIFADLTLQIVKILQEDFIQRAERFLQDGEKLVFSVEGRTVEIGLVGADGRRRRGLSGSEGVNLVTALLGALPEREGRALVLCLPDVDWDAEHLAEFMRRISTTSHQVVMASTTKPKGRMPAGWTLIDLDNQETTTTNVVRLPKKPTETRTPPKIPREGPDWLRACAKHTPALVEGKVQDWLTAHRPSAPLLTVRNLTSAPRFVVSEGVFHCLEEQGVVSFASAAPGDPSWVWPWKE